MHHSQPYYQKSHCRNGEVVADVEVLLSELAHDKAQCHERLSEPREDPCYHYSHLCVVCHIADCRSCWTPHTTTRRSMNLRQNNNMSRMGDNRDRRHLCF